MRGPDPAQPEAEADAGATEELHAEAAQQRPALASARPSARAGSRNFSGVRFDEDAKTQMLSGRRPGAAPAARLGRGAAPGRAGRPGACTPPADALPVARRSQPPSPWRGR